MFVAAGIERATGIVACLSNDNDNLLVTVSARMLQPEIRIVCRCIDERIEGKILKAGASAVVSPNRIGGLRMISEMVRPTAVSFLDLMLRGRDDRLRVESAEVSESSPLADTSLGDLRERGIEGLLVLALRREDAWIHAPGDSERLSAGVSLVFMGAPEARREVERLAASA